MLCGSVFAVGIKLTDITATLRFMANAPKKEKAKENGIPQMPFDDALKRILKAPPQHRVAKKKAKKK